MSPCGTKLPRAYAAACPQPAKADLDRPAHSITLLAAIRRLGVSSLLPSAKTWVRDKPTDTA
jgi:hypothetical protein